MDLIVVDVGGYWICRGGDKKVYDIPRLFSEGFSQIFGEVLHDSFYRVFDLIKNRKLGNGGMLQHGERVLDNKTNMHGYFG